MEPTHDEESIDPAVVHADGWSFINRPVDPMLPVGTPIYDQLVEDMVGYQPAPPPAAKPDGKQDPMVGTP